VKVGDLVKHSHDWAPSYPHEFDHLGTGLVIEEARERGGWKRLYFVYWSETSCHAWEHERDLEVVSESR